MFKLFVVAQRILFARHNLFQATDRIGCCYWIIINCVINSVGCIFVVQSLLPPSAYDASVPQSCVKFTLFPLLLDDSSPPRVPVIPARRFNVGLDTWLPSIRRFSRRTFKWINLTRIRLNNIVCGPEPDIKLWP